MHLHMIVPLGAKRKRKKHSDYWYRLSLQMNNMTTIAVNFIITVILNKCPRGLCIYI